MDNKTKKYYVTYRSLNEKLYENIAISSWNSFCDGRVIRIITLDGDEIFIPTERVMITNFRRKSADDFYDNY